MSLELHALIHKSRVPGPAAWQAAIDPLGFDLKIDHDFTPFEFSGFLPCKLNGELSGFEIYYDPAADLVEAYPDLQGQLHGRDCSISFRWGSRPDEGACVCIAAAALARASDALVFDPQNGEFYTVDALRADAKSLIKQPLEPPPPQPTLWRRLLRRLGLR